MVLTKAKNISETMVVPPPFNTKPGLAHWKILVVNQDKSVHSAIGLLLQSLTFKEKEVIVLNAHTAEEAQIITGDHPDVALVLLEMVPETTSAGLELINWIREESNNKFTRFVLCSGEELGQRLDAETIQSYDVEEFYIRCGMVDDSLLTVVLATLRIFDAMTMSDACCWHLNEDLQKQRIKLEEKSDELLRLTKAFETTEVGITITDNHQRIIYVNPADAKAHGFTVEELLGKPSNIFAVKESIAEPDAGSRGKKSHFETYVNWKRDRLNIRKDGSTFPVTLISNVIKNSRGENIGMVVACEDITDRKKAEEALRSSEQRLREMNITKDKFFSIIGHDLRNPLTTLMGYSELIVQRFDSLPAEKLKKMLMELNNSSEQLHKLIENLLEWSRVQSGKIPFDPKKIDVYEIAENTLALLRPSLKAKRIKVDSVIAPGTVVFVDFNMLHTVLRNLISNAIKFTEAGGSISLSTCQQDDLIEISVRDDGVGISEEVLSGLFRIEISHSARGTANETGTGLGLILCKEFVELHQGDISVSSELGKGATFSVKLPTTKEKYEELKADNDS
ncbi:MAG: PAS domain S-box protein [Desulfobulbaceae bacterium]|nr:PAS domain S-box protein [Desulfobulbaceae bacterium]